VHPGARNRRGIAGVAGLSGRDGAVMNAEQEQHAHHRLLNAVVSYIGAYLYGSKAEIRAAVIELHAARYESQHILYSLKSGGN